VNFVSSQKPADPEMCKVYVLAEHLPVALNIDFDVAVKSEVNNTIVSSHSGRQVISNRCQCQQIVQLKHLRV